MAVPFYNKMKELKREYGEEGLFRMLTAIAGHEQCGALEADDIGADEALRFMSEPQPEIFSFDRCATSETLADLAFGILDIKEGERVADLCCGSGAFLLRSLPKKKGVAYFGIERSGDAAKAAEARLSLFPDAAGAKIFNCDLFDAPEEKFDKIYCEPPFSLRFDEEENGAEFLLRELPWIKSLRRAAHISGCWSYVCKAVSMLAEGGRAVCVMSGGPLWNSFDAPVREHLVKNGLIEAVIALPGGVTYYPAPQATLVVLKRGCKAVTMADAREISAEGRRRKKLTQSRIDEIIAMLDGETEHSARVTPEEMERNEWQFFPGRYMQSEEPREWETVRLGDIASITRGAMIGARELEELSEGARNISVISYADIADGLLAENLGGISELPPRCLDCLLREGD